MLQSCSPMCHRHRTVDRPYEPSGVNANKIHKPLSGWTVEEDTALYEESTEENAPHLPHSCRCVELEHVLNRTPEALFFCEGGEADEQPMDFTRVTSASSRAANALARRPRPAPLSSSASGTSPSMAASSCGGAGSARSVAACSTGGGGDSRSGADVASPPSGGASSTGGFSAVATPSPTFTYTAQRDAASASPVAVRKKSVRISDCYLSDIMEQVNIPPGSQPHREKPELQEWRQTEIEAPHVMPSHPESPLSAASSMPCSLSKPMEREEDEHNRAVQAFLRENGFRTLTRRRPSIVGESYPLHCAVSQGLVRMTDLLIKAGADPSQKNSWGQTPVDVAKRCNRKGSHNGVLEVLQKASAAAAA